MSKPFGYWFSNFNQNKNRKKKREREREREREEVYYILLDLGRGHFLAHGQVGYFLNPHI
jgi:hypothetical protein